MTRFPAMNIEERARKIADQFFSSPVRGDELATVIAAELRAVREEGYRAGLNENASKARPDAYAKGLLRAADIFDRMSNLQQGLLPKAIADLIRKEAGKL